MNEDSKNIESLLNKAEAARFLNKKPTWIAYAVRHRLLDYVRVGQQLRFRIETLERFVTENTYRAKARGRR